MKTVVFVPGIMGSKLFLGSEQLWPPTVLETQLGYKRVDRLLDPAVRHGKIIRKVCVVDFYGSILSFIEGLGYTANGADKRLIRFPYDWRLDLEDLAEQLADRLDRAHADGAGEILLVAHSMGGLIARLVLETGRYAGRPWFRDVSLFAALATPHQGAPLALARVLGIDSTLGISAADFRRIASDRRYPSGYQLLPAPGEAACWDQSDPELRPVDIYDPRNARRLNLDPALLGRARFVHDSLNAGAPPAHVRYFYFAGTGHRTPTRVNVRSQPDGAIPHGSIVMTRTEDAGDGTVPDWSALPRAGQRQTVVGEHASVFTGTPFLNVFSRLLGGPPVSALEAAPGVVPATLSVDMPVQNAFVPVDLVVSAPGGLRALNGAITATPLDDEGAPKGPAEQIAALRYEGPRVTRLRLSLPGFEDRGVYRVELTGDGIEAAPVTFAVARIEEPATAPPDAN